MTDVGQMLLATFVKARQRTPGLGEKWVTLSYKIGGHLPNSLLPMSVQAAGHLDEVLRCIEDDFCPDAQEGAAGFVAHYQSMLSSLWMGQVYEVFRLVIERELPVPHPDEFRAIAHDLRITRVPLEKHEIAAHNKLPRNAEFVAKGAGAEDRIHVYDRGDLRRSHIMPSGVSDRGSVTWLAVDTFADSERWIERRAVSERVLALLD
jgi:hypothetical protein